MRDQEGGGREETLEREGGAEKDVREGRKQEGKSRSAEQERWREEGSQE
jgi:hypothetical protein